MMRVRGGRRKGYTLGRFRRSSVPWEDKIAHHPPGNTKTAKCYRSGFRKDVSSDPPHLTLGSRGSRETPAAHPSPSTRSYLLSSQQSGPPVHVILRFDHVHHLIGVQFEFTLQLVQALHVLHGLLTVSLLPFLLLLLPTTLTLTDPPQIPANQRIPLGISAHLLALLGWT